jgi:hypothetical protein
VTVQPAFYGRTGTKAGDLATVLHLPYTLWHLSYIAMGAALAPQLDAVRLAGTLAAFVFGLGVGAHALDEVHDRPLGTALSPRALWALGVGGLVAATAVAAAGAVIISPWVLVWAAVGITLALAYSLEWSPLIHSDLGFALAWGAFPTLVGFWAQTEDMTWAPLAMAAAATALSAVQRSLSKSAKEIRRGPRPGGAEELARWETPLRYLSVGVPLIALALLATHL